MPEGSATPPAGPGRAPATGRPTGPELSPDRHERKPFPTRRERFSFVGKRFSDLRKRFSFVGKRFSDLRKRFSFVGKRLWQVELRLWQVEKSFRQVEMPFRHEGKWFRQVEMPFRHEGKWFRQVEMPFRHEGKWFPHEGKWFRHEGKWFRQVEMRLRHEGKPFPHEGKPLPHEPKPPPTPRRGRFHEHDPIGNGRTSRGQRGPRGPRLGPRGIRSGKSWYCLMGRGTNLRRTEALPRRWRLEGNLRIQAAGGWWVLEGGLGLVPADTPNKTSRKHLCGLAVIPSPLPTGFVCGGFKTVPATSDRRGTHRIRELVLNQWHGEPCPLEPT